MFNRIIHLYWGKNQPLSYLRALTVLSFHKLNPDWDVRLWVPSVPSQESPWKTGEQVNCYTGHDYLIDLCDFVYVIDFESVGIPNSTPEVHKSDLLRWYLLAEYGGIWSDMDILYIKSLSDTKCDQWVGAGLCQYRAVTNWTKQFQAIGFLTSSGIGKLFFRKLFTFGLEQMPQEAYQAFGAELLNKYLAYVWPVCETLPFYHDPEIVYHYYVTGTMQQYFQPVELQLHPDTIGLHWYAGNPEVAKKECLVTEENAFSFIDKYVLVKEAWKLWEK